MTEVIGVKFKEKGKVYFFDPKGLTIPVGEHVIVDTAKGIEYACCTETNHMVDDAVVRRPLREVVRIATAEDHKRADELERKEAEAYAICCERIERHGLEMKLVDVECSFEGGKILFFFTSEGRVDFRDLVKDLASIFKTRIELRQIGVRDEARMIGGLGICGNPFCCASFLDDFAPVSIKMAKTQGLSLNPTKISGACGRLMCCLKYEQDAYEELVKSVPKVDAFVDTPQGKGSVMDVNILKRTVRVRLEDTNDTQIKTYGADEVEVLGGKAKRAEYLQQRAEEKAREELEPPKLRRPPLQPKPAPAVPATETSAPEETAEEAASSQKPPRQQRGRNQQSQRNRTRRQRAEGEEIREGEKAAEKTAETGSEQSQKQKDRYRPRRNQSGDKAKAAPAEKAAEGEKSTGNSGSRQNSRRRFRRRRPGGDKSAGANPQ